MEKRRGMELGLAIMLALDNWYPATVFARRGEGKIVKGTS